MDSTLVDLYPPGPRAILLLFWFALEVWHHYWSIRLIRGIDDLYSASASQAEREVDVVDTPSLSEFNSYWKLASNEFKARMCQWSNEMGLELSELIRLARDEHISGDFAQSVDPRHCVPITLLFRTWNTIRIFFTRRKLQSLGFRTILQPSVHLHYFSTNASVPMRPLLVIYPQFTGEFDMLSVFAELRTTFDILFVSPLSTQFSWWNRPGRHSDTLEGYLPLIRKYDHIHVVTWSAGNVHFQILDKFLEVTGRRDIIKSVVRLDPVGFPSSNFLIYSGVPLPWIRLWRKFFEIGHHRPEITKHSFSNHFGCIGLSYLLKCPHGYTYMKLGRMLRATKLGPAPYREHLFTAKCDPLFAPGHPVFDHDRQLLCNNNVVEYIVDGFHGLWLSFDIIRERVFPILIKNSTM